jgi:hypothetical protein
MWSIFTEDNRRIGIKATFLAVLATVFLSLITQGCYTKLSSSEPATGEREYSPGYYTYPDDFYDMGFSYYGWGWYRPFYSFSPFFYGMSYYPWWYDPWYYDGNYYPVNPPGNKDIRRRIRDTEQLGLPPGDTYAPPPPLEIIPNRGGSAPPSGNNSNDDDKTNEKTPRKRR